MSVWLRCATNEGHFAYRAHYLFASICASIRVTFLKLYVRAQISLLHLMYKREDWKVVCQFQLLLTEEQYFNTRWFKYDRDWFVRKQAALRSSCATLREWSHCAAAVRPWESEATTSTLPPARVRICSVLSGSCYSDERKKVTNYSVPVIFEPPCTWNAKLILRTCPLILTYT